MIPTKKPGGFKSSDFSYFDKFLDQKKWKARRKAAPNFGESLCRLNSKTNIFFVF